MFEDFTDDEVLSAMREMSIMSLIKLTLTETNVPGEKNRIQFLVDRIISEKPISLLQRYQTLVAMNELELRKMAEDYTDNPSDLMIIEDLLNNYLPKNEEVILLIAGNPDMFDMYQYFYDEGTSRFPFIIELFRNQLVTLPMVEKFLAKNKNRYHFEDIINSLQEHLTYDSYLPDYFRIVMRIYNKDKLPSEILDELFLKEDLNSTLRSWLDEMKPLSMSYAKKPEHVVYHPEINSNNLPSLHFLPVTEDKIIELLPQEQVDELDRIGMEDAWKRQFIIDSARLNGDEILHSSVLDLWFGMINPGSERSSQDDQFFLPSVADISNPERKYGAYRMLLDSSNEVSEESLLFGEDAPVNIDWFTGHCLQTDERIAYPHYAVRRPVATGGWAGCYSSWNNVLDHLFNMIDEYLIDEGISATANASDIERNELDRVAENHPFIKQKLAEVDLVDFFATNTRIADRNIDGESALSQVPGLNEEKKQKEGDILVSPSVFRSTRKRKDGTKSIVTVYSGKWKEPSLNHIVEKEVSIPK